MSLVRTLLLPRGLRAIKISSAAMLAIAGVTTVGSVLVVGPEVLFNTTPSEPLGLYARTDLPPGPGRLIAFRAPPAAFPYAESHLAYLHRVPLLKSVAAGPGDQVCAAGDVLTINGQPRGVISERDGQGRALPHWRECRILADGELFALANHVPNSFDSRYFGPVATTSVIGVFRPLWLLKEGR